MNNLVAEIKSRISCLDFVARYVKLRRVGNRFSAKCPFPDHDDKTPSFSVTPIWYKCFGCGRGGDVIDFAQKYLGISFSESVKLLATEAGIRCEFARTDESHSKLHVILKEAGMLYQQALENTPAALKYLESRGLYSDRKKFRLGWSGAGILPDGSLELLEKAGLAKGGRAFFRNRIMFPIVHQGNVCGFGARTIGNEKPKYLNSPENEVFDKSKLLYSVPIERGKSDSYGKAFLVEGYTDVIALAKVGLKGFAPMGTAITQGHLIALWKQHECIYVAFDGDVPGQKATERTIQLALPELAPNRTLRVINLPKGEDPSSILEKGIEYWHKCQPIDLIEILWATINQGVPEDREREVLSVARQVSQIKDQGLRESYIQALKIRRPKEWHPQVRLTHKPSELLIQSIFGILWRYPELCMRFQEQLAEIQGYEELKKAALEVAEGEDVGSEWQRASEWAQEFTDPEEVLRELFVSYFMQRNRGLLTSAKQRYLQDPTEENWRRLLDLQR